MTKGTVAMPQKTRTLLSNIRNELTLRQQIAIASAVLCLGIVAVLAGSAATLSRGQIETMTRERMQASATRFADRLDHYMFERYREIGGIAELGETHNHWTRTPTDIRFMLERVQARVPDYAWLGFVSRDGRVVAATGKMLEGASVAERNWFVNGLKAPTIEDVHEAVLLTRLLPPSVSGDPHRFVDVAVPIKDASGATIGVLGAHLDWNWSDLLRREATLPDSDGTTTEYLILSKDGKTLLGDDSGAVALTAGQLEELRAAPSGNMVDDDGGTTHLTGYAFTEGYRDYRSPGWIVLARRPAAVAFAAAREIGWFILGLGTIAAVCSICIAILMADRIARPVNLLIAETGKIGRDRDATMLPLLGGCAEVTKLSTALRSLLRRIGTAEEATRAAEQREANSVSQAAIDIQILRELANTDPLTHLPNRRAFLESARDAIQYFQRYKRPIVFFVIDIDHFKSVNDRFGHSAGDAVIMHVANVVAAGIRQTDKAARFGGEEFVVMLREIDEMGAKALADRLRLAVEAEVIRFRNFEINVTISIGVAIAVAEDRDIEDALERADQALYMAKNTGRNRVFCMPFTPEDKRRAA